MPAPRRDVFRVLASPWAHGYELEIVDVGVTQTHRDDCADAERQVREYISQLHERPGDEFDVVIEYPRGTHDDSP